MAHTHTDTKALFYPCYACTFGVTIHTQLQHI